MFHLHTTDGESLQIIKFGMHNSNSGPDFSEALVEIGGVRLAGHIELHRHSSEWIQHGHQNDNAYNNVVLHVVYEHDATTHEENLIGKATLQLKGLFNENLWHTYENWLSSKRELPCGNAPARVNPLRLRFWMERLFIERLSDKVQRIELLMSQISNSKEEVAYRMLLRYFGNTVNASAYERLSTLLPYTVLMKHRNQLVVMESLIYGCSGFLKAKTADTYVQSLQEHWNFYKVKYQLLEMEAIEWKLMRMRPVAFPGHRLAQLASLLRARFPLYSTLTDVKSVTDFETLFDIQLSSYWKKHYHFEKPSDHIIERPGKDFIRNLLINVALPLMYFEGSHQGNDTLKERAITFAAQTQPESNRIMRLYATAGLAAKSAADSQALIQLYHSYCTQKRCLSCAVGAEVLKG